MSNGPCARRTCTCTTRSSANSLLWSLYLLLTRHVVSGLALDAWAYTLVQLLAAGLVLLALGHRAPGSWRALLAPWTVTYAFLRVGRGGEIADAGHIEGDGIQRILLAPHAPHQTAVHGRSNQ